MLRPVAAATSPTVSPRDKSAAKLASAGVEAVCRHYLSNGRRSGRYWVAGDVRNTPGRSLFAGPVEIGAAWKRTSKDNSVYHSVKLDDPSFPAPIFANLVEVEGGYALVWSR